jgi:hypothetical protein
MAKGEGTSDLEWVHELWRSELEIERKLRANAEQALHKCRANLAKTEAALNAQVRVAELEEALAWYASPRTWNQWCPDSFGDRARKALDRRATLPRGTNSP